MNIAQVRYQWRHVADLAAALRLTRPDWRRAQDARGVIVNSSNVWKLSYATPPPTRRTTVSTSPRQALSLTAQSTDPPAGACDKSRLMEHFDELVCDPRLRRDEVLDWVGQITRDQLYLARYRVMLTSGSSGGRACSSSTPLAGDQSRPGSCAALPGTACGPRCHASEWPSSAAPAPPISAVKQPP